MRQVGLVLGRHQRGIHLDGAGESGGHSTVVAMPGGWAWPNENETQILIFADPSWMQVGQTLAIDDGVHTPGELLIVTIVPGDLENPTLVECAWTPVGPGGGTSMLDGAAVTLVV